MTSRGISGEVDAPAKDAGRQHPTLLAVWSMVAAFGTYACMYGLRKPFTAAAYVDEPFGAGFKVWLITAQVIGYTVSKFVGIRLIAEMPAARRAWALLALVGGAELALVLFALLPPPYSVACLFLNGLPLGLVFGLVLGFLEGRRLTEALVAGLCASFILADGMAKSVGTALLGNGVTERWMPGVAGLIFLPPLVGFVWMLQRIPPPSPEDVRTRSARVVLSRAGRHYWLRHHGLELGLIILAYLLITILRSLRADFAPELWAALGTKGQPGIFSRSEIWVALGVIAANGLVSTVHDHQRAFQLALGISLGGLALGTTAVGAQSAGWLGSFPFMVLLGLGLYLPYVAIHTTLFERLIALTRKPANLGYLMYLADATGYLGYVGVMLYKVLVRPAGDFLAFFTPVALSALSLAFFALTAVGWLSRRTRRD